jgi:hypothetical protein
MLALLVSSTSAEVLRHDFDNLDLEGWVINEDHQTVAIDNGELIAGFPPPEPDSTTLILLPFKGMPASDYDVTVSVRLDLFLFHPSIINGGRNWTPWAFN